MKKSLLTAFLGLAACGLALSQDPAATPAQTDANKPVFKFTEEVHNFGTIKQGDKVEYEFVFTNAGNEPLVITSAQGSCGCTVPEWPKEPVRKGETGKIKVTFNSAGKQGMQDKTITINSNAAENPKVLRIKGNIEVPAPAQQTTGTQHAH
jgi:hypothetical protein